MEMNRASAPAAETLETADLDNRGILQLQDQAMRRQDEHLEDLERSVTSTKVRSGVPLSHQKTAMCLEGIPTSV